jgi:hypothetical protein
VGAAMHQVCLLLLPPSQISIKLPALYSLSAPSPVFPYTQSLTVSTLLQAALSSDSVAALPLALWSEVLQHVPQQQRLSQCALVCRTWASAATAVTVHIQRELHPDAAPAAVPALQSWLALYAGQLLGLQLSVSCLRMDMLQLPLDELTTLQHLQLQSFKLRLPGDRGKPCSSSGAASRDCSSQQGTAALLTLSSLQHLELKSVELVNVSSLLQLTNAPQLRILKLVDIDFAEVCFSSRSVYARNTAGTVQQMANAISSLLRQLPLLSVLELPGFPFSDAAMQQTAAMQRLRHISIEQISHMQMTGRELQHLPSSITRLQLHCDFFEIASLPPELPQLSGLLQLDVTWCAFAPSVLSSMTHLQLLHLVHCEFLPMIADINHTEGTTAFLGVLASLTCLQDLELCIDNWDAVNVAPQHFAALTASSHLTQLALTQEDDVTLPIGAVQHMFPPGRQMQLLEVAIGTIISEIEQLEADEWCMDSADITRVIQACPQLQLLDIRNSVRQGADLSGLLQLPESCKTLIVAGAAFADAAVPLVVQLTQLKLLSWSWSRGFTDAGLEQLTALDLTHLDVHICGLSEELAPLGTMELRPSTEQVRGSRMAPAALHCWY